MTAAPSVPNMQASGTSRFGFSTAPEACAADSSPRNAQSVSEMLEPTPVSRLMPFGFQAAENVAPLNQVPGAVVSLMDRTNVETVIVAGNVRKWKGKLVDVDLGRLRRQLEDSRDHIFAAANIPKDLFRGN